MPVLTAADTLRLGPTAVNRVYAGTKKAWPPNYLYAGQASTPDTPDMSFTTGATRRLTFNTKVLGAQTGTPSFTNKAGAQREWYSYGYTASAVYISVQGPSGNMDQNITSVAAIGTPRVYGLEWTIGSNQAYALIDATRALRTMTGAAAIADVTNAVIVGNATLNAHIYWAQMETLDAPGGNVTGLVWRFDAMEYPGTGTTYTDARGRVWTLNAANAIVIP